MTTGRALKFGLAGAGYWPRMAHAPALAPGRVLAEAQRQIGARCHAQQN